MNIQLCLVYADGDAAATLLRHMRGSYAFVALLYDPFYIKSVVQLVYVQVNVIDRRAQVAMLQLTILNQRLFLLDDEVTARRRRRAIKFWVGPWLSADRRLKFGLYDQLIRVLRMEDSSSFFNYRRLEPLMLTRTSTELVLESNRATPTSGEHLNQI